MSTLTDLDVDVVELAPWAPTEAAAPLREVAFRANAWLPHEDARLREMFAADASIAEMSDAIGRLYQAVRNRICVLGLRRNSLRPWSELEDEEVVRRYGQEPVATIAQDLARSPASVYARGAVLGVSAEQMADWSEWEDAQLRAGYASGVPVEQIAQLIGRKFAGVNSRAYKLRLTHSLTPPGWTGLEAARALELAHEGAPYPAIVEQLVAEGHPRRSVRGFGLKVRALGYGRGWGRRWTPEEDEALRQAYARGENLVEVAERIGRGRSTLRWRCDELGLQGSHPRPDGFRGGPVWTPEDEATLRAQYGKMKNRELARLMGRSLGSINTRANVLGLEHGFIRKYSADEDRAILIGWRNGLGLRHLAEAMGRDVAALHKHAVRLGISFGDPRRPSKASKRRIAIEATYSLADILALEPEATILEGVAA